MEKIFLIFQDQLSIAHPLFSLIDKEKDKLVVPEFLEDYTSLKHHKKKLVFLLSALRHFVLKLKEKGYRVDHYKLFESKTPFNLKDFLSNCPKKTQLFLSLPSDYQKYKTILDWSKKSSSSLHWLADPKFLSSLENFYAWAKGKKTLRMEFFYREMRKKFDILMESGKPEGGKWNYDQQNRQPLGKGVVPPSPFRQKVDAITQEVFELVNEHFSSHFGDISPFFFAVDRQGALEALNQFIEQRLPSFGDYQDAMLEGNVWLFHSHLSLYLNIALLTPKEVIDKAIEAYRDGKAPLNAVEGFIRQIMGWREFVRGIYWLRMPQLKKENALNATTPLPSFFWDGNTKMNCIKQCVLDTKQHAYAHHIQRLMVLGNFCLLIGANPDEVNEWYHLVYADAFEWVEMPNVSGMILFADGGVLASKPYAASGSYIQKMSNYCSNCAYNVKEKQGKDACPFNYLYWYFLDKNKEHFSKNPRLSMIYKTLEKFSTEKLAAIQEDSSQFLKTLAPPLKGV